MVTKGLYLSVFFLELLVAAEVLAEADLEEDERAVLAVEGVGLRGRVGRHSLVVVYSVVPISECVD